MGTGPIFGYPPICYSPPNELKKESSDGNDAISVLMKHIFQKNDKLATISTLLAAKKDQDNMVSNL